MLVLVGGRPSRAGLFPVAGVVVDLGDGADFEAFILPHLAHLVFQVGQLLLVKVAQVDVVGDAAFKDFHGVAGGGFEGCGVHLELGVNAFDGDVGEGVYVEVASEQGVFGRNPHGVTTEVLEAVSDHLVIVAALACTTYDVGGFLLGHSILHLFVGQDAFFDHERQLRLVEELGQLFEGSSVTSVSVLILDLSRPNLNQALLDGRFASLSFLIKLNRPHNTPVAHVDQQHDRRNQ